MWTRVCGALVLVAVAVAVGCGGSGEDKDKEAAGKDCGPAAAAMSGQPTLPTGFPTPDQVTYTGQIAKGPTSVVKGYFDGDIDEAFDTYKNAFEAESPPYQVDKSEQEKIDAEIEWAEGLFGKNGQVKLLQTCKERTSVTLTIRPE